LPPRTKDTSAAWRASTSSLLAGGSVVCVAVDVPRALPAEDLAALWRAADPAPVRIETAPSVDEGLQRAMAIGDGPIVVAGSLYLVGAVRGAIVHDEGP